MKAATAIRKYLAPVTMLEIKDLKMVCTDTEWQQFGKDACAEMGEVFEPVK